MLQIRCDPPVSVRAGLSQPAILIAVLAGCLITGPAGAQSSGGFFGSRFDSGMLAIQEKVEALYQQGEYERALFIYENELAPLGDKYAQYMVGFMHLTGTGVPEDAIEASAWYRLAAERSYPEFVAVRDRLLEAFSEPDLLNSDQQYRALRRKYSDLVILERLIREDLKLLEPSTGSRLAGSSSAITVLEPRSGKVVPVEQVQARARQRIEERLDLIDAMIEPEKVETDVDRLDLDVLRQQIDAALERIDDR